MKVIGIIPARYNSTRFPGKPLVDIKGKTMIRRVYEGAIKAKHLDDLVVTTDDQRIYDHVIDFGGKAIMTDESIPSGTDRVWQAYHQLKKSYDVVLNIQGDEPLINVEHIDLLIGIFEKRKNAQIGTLAKPMQLKKDIKDPNKVKVVFSSDQKALYFSRSPIPFERDKKANPGYFQHIGIYGFKSSVLDRISKLESSPLELTEQLEQLRWLENDMNIHLEITNIETPSVDCPKDLENLIKNYGSSL